MESEVVAGDAVTFATRNVGIDRPGVPNVVWGHGWGQSGAAMLPLAESLGGFVFSTIIDFPGFGASPMPPAAWGTENYADAVAEWLKTDPRRGRFWVGHSFGGRVGIRLAARHPELFDGLVLIASAGLPRRRGLLENARFFLRRNLFRLARRFVSEGPALDRLRARLGSSDYRSAGPLRPILTKVVSEDLSADAAKITCPVLLLYGDKDTETPVEIGERFRAIIPHSQLVVLEGLDHLSILGDGRHQSARHILRFVKGEAR